MSIGRAARRCMLFGIMAVFFLLSVVVSVILPPRQGPDESEHYNYVRSIAKDFRLPSPSADRVSVSTDVVHRPPLYYSLAAVPFALADAIFEQRGAPLRAVRLFGAFVGLLWVYFSYRLARQLFPKDDLACLFCTAFASWLPPIVYFSGVVADQVTVGAFFAGSLWMTIRFVQTGLPRLVDAVLFGLLLGLAILAGDQALILVPVAVVAVPFALRRQEGPHRHTVWRTAAVALLTALVVSMWWFVRNRVVYGLWIVHPGHEPMIAGGWLGLASHAAASLGLLYRLGISLFANFWSPFDFATAAIVQSRLYLTLMSVYTAVGLCGIMIFLFVTRGDRQAEEPMDRGDILLILALAFFLLAGAIYWHTALVDRNTIYKGYLLLPAAGPVGAVLVAGYRGLSSARRTQIRLMAFAVAVIVVLNTISLLAIWSRYSY